MIKIKNSLKSLQHAKYNGGTVTYHFKDGTRQVSEISKNVFINEKGRQRELHEVVKIFETTAHDLGAISYEL